MRGGAQLAQLTEAMAETRPSCTDDARFIADHLTDADTTLMRRICRSCPLSAMCNTFARSSKPEAGFWAGTDYSTRRLGRPPKEPR